jgi:osmotically-inducible protein OsmY
MNDRQLRQLVIDELEFQPNIDASHIGVTVDRGVVTLSGRVPNYSQKVSVLGAARRVKGVRTVAQEIEVQYAGERPADEEIAKRALSILEWDAIIPGNSVDVTVQDGWVELRGLLTWQFERKAAEVAIRKLSGVVGVTNMIALKPSLKASDIEKKIESALARYAYFGAMSVKVRVSEDKQVSLEGQVHSWDEHDVVEDAVWAVPGVDFVDDRISVAP